MKTENFSLANATAVQIFATRVRVIRYDEGAGTGTPTIRVRSMNTGELDVEMKPGRQIIMPQAVDGIIITNLTANPITGKVTIGAGDVSDNSLVGTVTLDAPTLAALESVDLNAGTLATVRHPLQKTASFTNAAALAANTPVTVFNPAANLNGAILLNASMYGYIATGGFAQAFIAKNSAPAEITDGDVICSGASVAVNGSNWYLGGSLDKEQFIEAGLGLYFLSNAATGATTADFRHCRYRLL